MSKMNIYITRQLSFATIFIAIVLTVAVWLTQSLRFVDIVVNKGLDISTFFYLVSLLIPDLLSIVLPAALLMATLFVYNKLIAENELIVMKAIGMSPLQILKPALQVTAFVMLILYAINLYILPLSFRKLRDLEHDIRNRMSISMLQSGQFNNFKDLTIYIRKISSDGDVSGIIIHNSQDEKKPYTITARKGAVIKKEKETRLVLIDGIRHEYPQNKGSPSSVKFDQYMVDLNEDSFKSQKRTKKPYEYYTYDLLFPNKTMGKTSTYPKFIAQGHQRIISPLHALIFVLIGLAILLVGDFNRRGRAKKNVTAAALCTVTQVISLTFLNLSEKIPFMIFVTYGFVFLVITIFLLYFTEKIDFDSTIGEALS